MKKCTRFALTAIFPLLITFSSFAQPPGFTYLGALDAHNYYVSNVLRTWPDAKDACSAAGGYLVCIGSQAENDFITGLLPPYVGAQNHVWIGFNDVALEGHWVWVNGEPVVYTNWESGEPNEMGGWEDYGMIYAIPGHPWNGQWNDVGHQNYSFYCVMEMECPQPWTPDDATVALYHCDEGFGTVLSDATTNHLNGSLNSDTAWFSNECGISLLFNGVNSRDTVPDNDLLDLTGPLTIECWAFLYSIGNGQSMVLVGKDGDHSQTDFCYALTLKHHRDQCVNFVLGDNGPGGSTHAHVARWTTPLAPFVNRWTHFAGVWDGTSAYLYVDDILRAKTIVGPIVLDSTPNSLLIGSNYYNNGDANFHGRIDEIRISNSVRYDPPQLVHLYDHFCLNFDEPGQVKTVYWCCPYDGRPLFGAPVPGCDQGIGGCNESCTPYLGPVTWIAQYDSICTLPGGLGWWSARFTAQGEGCVCVSFDRQLAVELSSLAAVATTSGIEVRWTTASEIDNDRFEIHRASESGAWVKIGTVAGHGTSSTAHHYTYLDENVQTGITYRYRLASVDLNEAMEWVGGTVSATPNASDITPTTYALHQNHPNPFNPTTEIVFEIAEARQVTLNVFNVAGQEVARLLDGVQTAGLHHITFDGSTLPSGVYFYSLSAGSFMAAKKMLLLK